MNKIEELANFPSHWSTEMKAAKIRSNNPWRLELRRKVFLTVGMGPKTWEKWLASYGLQEWPAICDL